MADPTTPTTAPQPTLADKLKMDFKTLWNNYRVFLILFGVVILIVKFRDVIIDILLNSAKRVMTNAQKQDASLSAKESADNKAADALVQDAKNLPSTEQPVTADWNQKK